MLFIFYFLLFRKSSTPTTMLFCKSMLKGPTILLINLNKNISKILKCIKNTWTIITNYKNKNKNYIIQILKIKNYMIKILQIKNYIIKS